MSAVALVFRRIYESDWKWLGMHPTIPCPRRSRVAPTEKTAAASVAGGGRWQQVAAGGGGGRAPPGSKAPPRQDLLTHTHKLNNHTHQYIMRTNIDIDDALMDEARGVSGGLPEMLKA